MAWHGLASQHELRANAAGAGMFIGTVVLGAVVHASKGASVRGALIRDVSAYALAVAMVAWILGSGQVSAARLNFASCVAQVCAQQPDRLVACCRSPRARRCCCWAATWCMCWQCAQQTSSTACGGVPRSPSTCESVY
jgi:hypothetical protein